MNGINMTGKLCRAMALGVAAMLIACSDPATVEAPAKPVLNAEQLRESLLAQDRRFAEIAYTEGVPEAYRRFLAADAVQLPDGGLPTVGRDEIYQMLLSQTEGVDFSLTWETLEARVAESGELGFTWGVYYYESVDELGAPYVAEGKYVYVWRYNAGRWEVILDMTNQTEPDYQDYEEWLEEEYSEDSADDAEAEALLQEVASPDS